MPQATIGEWMIGILLVLSSIGVLCFKRAVHACLSFLGTSLMLAILYLQLTAEFIGVMQILVYAGAILVIFMFVIILFQDAHDSLSQFPAKSSKLLISIGASAFIVSMFLFLSELSHIMPEKTIQNEKFGSVEALGYHLYTDFFFPFEATLFLFLLAIVGTLYIGKKEA